jgi:hypothetical protein
MSKTPEQQEADAQAHTAAQEYAEKTGRGSGPLFAIAVGDFLTAYAAGHAAGKQDERERIVNALPNADHILIDASGTSFINLNSVMAIITGGEKV